MNRFNGVIDTGRLAQKLRSLPQPSCPGSAVMTKGLGWVCRCALSAIVVLAALGATGEAKTFRWANDGDPTTMDPHARSDLFVTSFDMNMYEPLLRRNRELKLEPALVCAWAHV